MRTKLLLILFAFGPIQIAAACSCGTRPDVKEAFNNSAVVLKGRVIDIDSVMVFPEDEYELALKDTTKGLPYFPLLAIKLQVEQVYKGKGLKHEFVVLSAWEGMWCGFPFELNKAYIVYAYVRPGFIVDERKEQALAATGKFQRIPPFFPDKLFETEVCTRTVDFNKKEHRALMRLR